jgi:hypothetical protein
MSESRIENRWKRQWKASDRADTWAFIKPVTSSSALPTFAAFHASFEQERERELSMPSPTSLVCSLARLLEVTCDACATATID